MIVLIFVKKGDLMLFQLAIDPFASQEGGTGLDWVVDVGFSSVDNQRCCSLGQAKSKSIYPIL